MDGAETVEVPEAVREAIAKAAPEAVPEAAPAPASEGPIPEHVEIAVVGAGLAGLTAARHLAQAGRDVHLFDQNPEPGGRVRAELVDGYRLDLGFQVLLTGYPAVQEELDLERLALCSLEPGCVIVRDGRHHSLPDPFRTPNRWIEAALFPLATIGDKLKTRTLRNRLKEQTEEQIFSAGEQMAAVALRNLGFSERFLSTFWIPFFSAVFLDPPLEVTTRMFNFVFRSIALGDIVLPRGGMGAIAEQIAGRLPPGVLHPRTRATALQIEGGRVRGLTVAAVPAGPGGGPDAYGAAGFTRLTPGRPAEAAPAESGRAQGKGPAAPTRTVRADHVILASGPEDARRLGKLDLPLLEPLGVSVVYFAANHIVTRERRIFLNGGGSSPGHHCVFLSNVCPSYAPPGSQLVSVTILGTPEGEGSTLAERVRRQMAIWFPQGQTDDWRWLATYKVPLAQFRQPPGLLGRLPGPLTPIQALVLAGDYTRHSSVQGALESGQIAARMILEGRTR
jgi:phytoene dehydrogenase-like protein